MVKADGVRLIIPILLFVLCCSFYFTNRTTVLQHTTSLATGDSLQTTIYDDSLSSQWENWSWNTTVTMSDTTMKESGSNAISFIANTWGALYLHTASPILVQEKQSLQFALRSAQPNAKFSLLLYDEYNQPTKKMISLDELGGSPPTDSWKVYTISLTELAPTNTKIQGFALQETAGASNQLVYIDTITLITPQNMTTQQSSLLPSIYEVYTDSLSPTWTNWSWNADIKLTASPAFKGSSSLSFTPKAWGALYLHTDDGVNTAPFSLLSFAIKGISPDTKLVILLYDELNNPIAMQYPLPVDPSFGENDTWKTYSLRLSDLQAQNKIIKGFALQEIGGKNQSELFIDAITLSSQPLLAPEKTSTTTTSSIPREGYTATDGDIYKYGSPITLRGINWFGAETGTHVFHGLWARNWKDMIVQIKQLGFNAVRVPFCPATLHESPVVSIDYEKNPDLAALNSTQVLDKILQEMNTQELYILLDHHRPDCESISQLWYTDQYSENEWISDLQLVANRYKHLEYFLGLDIKNEPHGKATWGTGNKKTDWNTAAEKAGQAILSTNQNLLIFVQGIQESSSCSSDGGHWQGGNFEPQNCTPISTTAIPSHKLVFSPHVYGPDVWNQEYFSAVNFPSNMENFWEKHFGFLTGTNSTIVPGEWGGKYGTGGGNEKDITLQNNLVSYFIKKGICNSFYWDFNPNSTDTGGILQDDWITPWNSKIQLVRTYYTACK